MKWLRRLAFVLVRVLLRPVLWAVKPQIIPENLDALRETLQGQPVCYVLRQHSWSDRLVLERLCRQLELPVVNTPSGDLPTADSAACLYLPVIAELDEQHSPRQLVKVIAGAAGQQGGGIQIVPVSIFWGRDPGTETSILKLLVGDAELAGGLRKLLIMLVQGRSALVKFAEPIDFDSFLKRQPNHLRAAELLHRGLSFHFLRQKTATLGPSLLSVSYTHLTLPTKRIV